MNQIVNNNLAVHVMLDEDLDDMANAGTEIGPVLNPEEAKKLEDDIKELSTKFQHDFIDQVKQIRDKWTTKES